jgi:predicted CoA-binding protein
MLGAGGRPMSRSKERVVVLGASTNPERYSNMAVRRLLENDHEVVPVHPALEMVEGVPVTASPGDIDGPVDTVTVYVSPAVSSTMTDAIIALGPRRVIFNPGAENPDLEAALDAAGIETVRACTLVLLSTGQF